MSKKMGKKSGGTVPSRYLDSKFKKVPNTRNKALPVPCTLGYSDYDVFLENDRGSRVYRCKKLF